MVSNRVRERDHHLQCVSVSSKCINVYEKTYVWIKLFESIK